MGHVIRARAIPAALATLALAAPASLALAGPGTGGATLVEAAAEANPLAGQRWWDQNTPYNLTWNGYRKLAREGRQRDAADVRLLAEQPQFRWWGQWERPIEAKLSKTFAYMDRTAPGSVPLLAVFGHKGDGCGPSYLGGGAAEDARYRRFIRGFARGIGSRQVVIAFEPDSLGTVECLARHRRDDRLRTLAYGVDTLSKLPNATIYVEGGAADWQGSRTMARKLRAVGVHKVRGFMVNATHQVSSERSISYGLDVSRRLGGKHFIVNTSHNGNGAYYGRRGGKRVPVWCNPPNAAAGVRPTTHTPNPRVDAYMWVERPGFSNGACNGGPQRVGAWWEQRALQMVRRAAWYPR